MAKTKSNAAKNIIVLFVIALVSVSLLAVLHEVTNDPIAAAEEQARQDSYKVAYEDADEFVDVEGLDLENYKLQDPETKVTFNAVLEAKKGGEKIGYVINASSPKGYGGEVQIAIGITNEGEVKAFTVVSAANESPGFGANALKPEFQEQFAGLSALSPIAYSKTGADRSKNEFDAISGATITTSAVTDAVNEAVALFNSELKGE